MKQIPGFDDEFRPKGQRWFGRVRSIGWMMSFVAVCGVVLAVSVGIQKSRKNRLFGFHRAKRVFPVPRPSALMAGLGQSRKSRPSVFHWDQRAVPVPRLTSPLVPASDRFVVVAAAEIDPTMVVAAPEGIDEAMVFNPERRGGTPVDAMRPQFRVIPVPGDQPGQVPGNALPPPSAIPATPR